MAAAAAPVKAAAAPVAAKKQNKRKQASDDESKDEPAAEPASKSHRVSDKDAVKEKAKESFKYALEHPSQFLVKACEFSKAVADDKYKKYKALLAVGHEITLCLSHQYYPESSVKEYDEAQVLDPTVEDYAYITVRNARAKPSEFVLIAQKFERVLMDASINGGDIQMLLGFAIHATHDYKRFIDKEFPGGICDEFHLYYFIKTQKALM